MGHPGTSLAMAQSRVMQLGFNAAGTAAGQLPYTNRYELLHLGTQEVDDNVAGDSVVSTEPEQ